MNDSPLFDVALDPVYETELNEPDERMLRMQIQSHESTMATLKAKNARLESANSCMNAKLEQVHANFFLVLQASRREISKLKRNLNVARKRSGVPELKAKEEKQLTEKPSLDAYAPINYTDIITYLHITSDLNEDVMKSSSTQTKVPSAKSMQKAISGRSHSSSSSSSCSSSESSISSGSSSSSSSSSVSVTRQHQSSVRRGVPFDKTSHKSSVCSHSNRHPLPESIRQQHRVKSKPKTNITQQDYVKHNRSTEEIRGRERQVDAFHIRGKGNLQLKSRDGEHPAISSYKRMRADEQTSSRLSSTSSARPSSSRHREEERQNNDKHREKAKSANRHAESQQIRSPLRRSYKENGSSIQKVKPERERELKKQMRDNQVSAYSTISNEAVSSADSPSPERARLKQRISQDSVSVSPGQKTTLLNRKQFSRKSNQKTAEKSVGPVTIQADRLEAQLLRAAQASVRSARNHHSASIMLSCPTSAGKRLTAEEKCALEAYLYAEEQRCIENMLASSASVKKAQSLSPHATGGTLFTKRQRAKADSVSTIATTQQEERQSSRSADQPGSAPNPSLLIGPPPFQETLSLVINGDVIDVNKCEPIRPGRPMTPPDEREDEAHYRSLHGDVGGDLNDNDNEEDLDFSDDQAPISPIIQLDKAVSAAVESPQIDIENEYNDEEEEQPIFSNHSRAGVDTNNKNTAETEEREDGEMISDYDDDDPDDVGVDMDRSLSCRTSKHRPMHQPHRHHRERTRSPPSTNRPTELSCRRQKRVDEEIGQDEGNEEEEEEDFRGKEEERNAKRARYSDPHRTDGRRLFTEIGLSSDRRRRIERSANDAEYLASSSTIGRQGKRCRTPSPPIRKRPLRRPSPIIPSSHRGANRQYSASREPRFSRQNTYRMVPTASRYSVGGEIKNDPLRSRIREGHRRSDPVVSTPYPRRPVVGNRSRQLRGSKFNSSTALRRSRFIRR